MKLWLLRARDNLKGTQKDGGNPWRPWYDKTFGFVVRASNEMSARAYAAEQAGDERPEAWLHPEFSTCVPLIQEGNAGVIIRDYHSA